MQSPSGGNVVPALISLGIVSKLDSMALATYCQATADWRRYQRLITKRNDASDDDLGGDIQTFKTGAQQMHVLRQLANDAENAPTPPAPSSACRLCPGAI